MLVDPTSNTQSGTVRTVPEDPAKSVGRKKEARVLNMEYYRDDVWGIVAHLVHMTSEKVSKIT